MPIYSIGMVLAFAFIANYSGLSATLALALAHTGDAFPFFSPFLGWLGVFLTGSDTSSNALFSALQATTAQQIGVSDVLLVAANTTGGVTGKMISPQSIAIACAAVGLAGKESDLFRFTVKHSLIFTTMVGLITLAQAYWLTWMIPEPCAAGRPPLRASGHNGAMSTQRISDKVAAQLRGLVQEQQLRWATGCRKRTLAVQLGVSRTALREAIAQLASQGLLTARVGGGTYVAEPAARARQALDEPLAPYLPLFQGDPEYRFDVLEIRHALEGATAWHAALRATDEDRARIAQAFQTMMDAHGKDDPTGEAEADAAFHLSIAEASHNLVLLQVMRGLFELLQTNISQSREKLYTSARTFSPLSDQHREMMDAVLAGDPERARAAAHAHLEFVHTTLRTLDDNEARRARASRLPSPRLTP